MCSGGRVPDSVPDHALSIGLTARSQRPRLYNGSKEERVRRKNTWSSWFGVTVLALLCGFVSLTQGDTTYRGLSVPV